MNDLDPEDKGFYKKLKQNVKPYMEFIVDLTKDDANVIYSEILKRIPKEEWSIFFLDPFKYKDLDWKTIEEISKHECEDPISRCVRKPELIINLMTCTMQRAFKHDPDGITKALGTDEWIEKVKNKSDEKVHEIFSEIFIKRLEELGYYVNSFYIKQILPNNNILYYMIFASAIPNANDIISRKYKPYIDRMMKEKWIKEHFKYRLITRAKKAGTKLLTEF